MLKNERAVELAMSDGEAYRLDDLARKLNGSVSKPTIVKILRKMEESGKVKRFLKTNKRHIFYQLVYKDILKNYYISLLAYVISSFEAEKIMEDLSLSFNRARWIILGEYLTAITKYYEDRVENAHVIFESLFALLRVELKGIPREKVYGSSNFETQMENIDRMNVDEIIEEIRRIEKRWRAWLKEKEID